MNLRAVKSIDGAIKIAVHHHLPALAERMNQIKERKMNEPEAELGLSSSFDIKSYIKDELEKVAASQLASSLASARPFSSLSQRHGSTSKDSHMDDDRSDVFIAPSTRELSPPMNDGTTL